MEEGPEALCGVWKATCSEGFFSQRRAKKFGEMAGKHVDDMDNRLMLLKERPKPPQTARNQSWINLVEVHGSLVGDESRCHGLCIIAEKGPKSHLTLVNHTVHHIVSDMYY